VPLRLVGSEMCIRDRSERALKLADLRKAINKLPKALKRNEIRVVAARLSALGINLPIPKGIDPRRARPVRK
jgi:hypothetical protein